MERKDIEAIYPLSPMQLGMLFHGRYAPAACAYFEQMTFAIEGRLEVDALIGAWQRVIDRHPILRTLFLWKDRDEPLQVVRRKVRLPWTRHDWRHMPTAEREKRLEALRRADQEAGFVLTKAPLMRLTLIQAEETLHYLVCSFHHALLDRWSVSIVMKEVRQAYGDLLQGRASLRPGVPYQDYVRWCRRQDRGRAEMFWRETLRGFTSPVRLGGDTGVHARAGERPYLRQELLLPSPASSAVKAFSRAHRLTLNTLVQGAWALVLARESGADEVIHGVTVSTRPAEVSGIDAMVGCLLNTLPLRVRVEPEESVLSWLRQVQKQLLELREHDYSSLIDIQGWSEAPRGRPLFESIVVFENVPLADPTPREGGLKISIIHARESSTGYPLTVAAVPGSELWLSITYDSGRFETPAVQSLLGYLATVLEWLAAAPDQPLSALPNVGRAGVSDRAPLAGPFAERQSSTACSPPRTPVEMTLARIWEEVLNGGPVHLEDDFFALGGHSLKATQAASRISDAFGVDLSLAEIFEAPILVQLARRIEAAQQAEVGARSQSAL